MYIGIAGMANSLLLLTVREPIRGHYDEESLTEAPSNICVFLKQAVVRSFGSPVMRWIIIACAFRISAGFCIGFYYVTYVTQQFSSDKTFFSYF